MAAASTKRPAKGSARRLKVAVSSTRRTSPIQVIASSGTSSRSDKTSTGDVCQNESAQSAIMPAMGVAT